MIYFLILAFKQPQYHSIHLAIEDARAAEWALKQSIAYYHVTQDTNYIVEDMARWALEAQATIIFWDGHVPGDRHTTSCRLTVALLLVWAWVLAVALFAFAIG